MGLVEVAAATSALVHFFLGITVLASNPRGRLNQIFATICWAFCAWAFGYSRFVAAESEADAWFWLRLMSVGFTVGPVLTFHYFAELTGKATEKRVMWALRAAHLLGLAFWAKALFHHLTAEQLVWRRWGWEEILRYDALDLQLHLVFVVAINLTGLYWTYEWGRKPRYPIQRILSRVVLATAGFALSSIVVSNVLLRGIEMFNVSGLAPVFIGVWSVSMWYAVVRYKLMVVDSSFAADEILATMRDAVILVDPEGSVLLSNAAASKLFGEHLKGQSIEQLFEDDPTFVESIKGHPDGNARFDMEWLCSKGVYNLSVSTSAVTDAQGGLGGIVLLFQDISEVSAAQEALQEATDLRLAQADRMASVGLLAAGVAHEINNPLGFILNNMEFLKQKLEARTRQGSASEDSDRETPLPAEEILPLVEEARSGAVRVAQIVSDLNSFSRARDDSEEAVYLDQAVGSALNIAHNDLRYRAKVEVELEPTPPVLASEGRICQVFLNLLVNAGQAMDESDKESNVIWVRSWFEDGESCVEVEDNGKGIPPDIITHIFDPFFSTSGPRGGAGLGLSISHNIISKVGGRIEVSSSRSEGTSFVVRIPSIEEGTVPPAPIEASPPPRAPRSSRGRRVLIVDDEPILAKAMGRNLASDFDVSVAHSVADAESLVESEAAFDVVFCDVMMEDRSGVDFHKWLVESHPELSGAFYFVTGGAFTEQNAAYIKESMAPVLQKPLTAEDLRNAALEAVGGGKR